MLHDETRQACDVCHSHRAAPVHPASEPSALRIKLQLCAQRSKGRAELTFMMEQYLDGPEVDVDVVLNAEGDVVYGNVTDNWPTIEPYFNETGKPLLAKTGEVPRSCMEL